MPSSHLTFFDKIVKYLNANRVSRMHKHYLAIKEEVVARTPKERQEAAFFKERFESYYGKTHILINIRFLCYIMLYASLIVNVFKFVPFLYFLAEFIKLGSAIIGTTVSFILIVFLTMRINLHIELMNEALTHLIVLYHRNKKRNTKETLIQISKTI